LRRFVRGGGPGLFVVVVVSLPLLAVCSCTQAFSFFFSLLSFHL